MASIFKRGTTWYADWTDEATGQRHRPRLGSEPDFTESDAERALTVIRGELAAGSPVAQLFKPRRASERWADFADRYLTWHEAEYPDSHWRIKLIFEKQFSSWALRHLDTIDLAFIETWLAKRKQQVAPTTAAKELRTLKAALNKAVAWGLMQGSPAVVVKAPKDLDDAPVVFYTAEELQKLYAIATPRNAAIWKLLVNTGMRRAEALQLRWADVGATALAVKSAEHARTKSGKWRQIPISPGAREALDTLRDLGTDPVVPRRIGAMVLPALAPHSLTRQFRRDLRRAKLPGNLHQLRHTFASHLIMQGRTIEEVKELLGHASIETTQIYAHLAPAHMQAVVSNLNL